MKNVLLLLLLLTPKSLQAQGYEWAIPVDINFDYDSRPRLYTSSDGICYMASGSRLVKALPNGHFAYFKTLPGKVKINGVSGDQAGNIYLGCTFSDTLSFQGIKLQSRGGTDIALLKLDPAGSLLWYRQEGDTGNDEAGNVKVDRQGDPWICGSFTGKLSYPNQELRSDTLRNFFYAHYTADGSAVKGFCGKTTSYYNSTNDYFSLGIEMEFDDHRNVYVFMHLLGMWTAGEDTLRADPDKTSYGDPQTYLLSYDSIGRLLCTRNICDNWGGDARSLVYQGSLHYVLNQTYNHGASTDVIKLNSACSQVPGGIYDISADTCYNCYERDYHSPGIAVVGDSLFTVIVCRGYSALKARCRINIEEVRHAGKYLLKNSMDAGFTQLYAMTSDGKQSLYYLGYGVKGRFTSDTLETKQFYLAKYNLYTVLSAQSPARESSVRIYPNPSTRDLTIENTGTISTITIYNALGEKVLSQDTHEKAQVDISTLPRGMYLVRIQSGDQVLTRKIMLQ